MSEDVLIVIIVFLCLFGGFVAIMFAFALEAYGKEKKKCKRMKHKFDALVGERDDL